MNIRNFAILAMLLALPLMAEDGPKVTFKKMQHSFGDIEKGEKVNTSFDFTNSGTATLEILNVAASCGCTTADLKKKVYEPGESGSIPVTFDSTRFADKITKRITVTTNDKASPKVVLTIEGNVLVDVVAEPSALFMAKARPHAVNTAKITVSTKRLERLELSNLKIQPEFFNLKEERVDDKTINLIVEADGKKFPKGKTRLNGYLTYDTNSTTMGTMRAAVTINVVQPVQVSPRAIYFYASKVGKQREMKLTLRTTTDKPFKVLKMSSDLGFIDLKIDSDEGMTKTLLVTLSDKAPEGKFSGFITLETDVEGQKEVAVNIRGSVIP